MMSQMEIEEEMLLSCLLQSSSFGSSANQVETVGGEANKVRRRRRKARGGDASAISEAKKRRLTDAQVKFLEMNFGKERKLESGRKVHLATELGLDPKQVAVWFQNRRARWKNKQLEEEYARLKSVHDTILVEKCHLENEVLKLKTRLSDAEEEIRKLSGVDGGSNGGSGINGEAAGVGSPSSSIFSTATQQPLIGTPGFGLEGDTDMMYVNEYRNYMEWYNLYAM